MSGLLASQQRTALSDAWTITPVGGSDKVTTLVATLIDFQKRDQQTIENLYKKKLLAKNNVHTFARARSARVVQYWSVTCLWVGIVDGQFRVMHQRLRSAAT